MVAPRFTLEGPHGVMVAVRIDEDEPRDALLSRLLPEEAALAATWGDPRARTFAAGRIALREAMAAVGVDVKAPILRSPRGAPLLPVGVRASVSHKDRIAVAMAALGDASVDGFVGVDVEELDVKRDDVSRLVLTDAERAELASLDDDARRRALLLRFSLKESLYKGLDPWVRRYVGFLEVEARVADEERDDGHASFVLALKHGEGPFDVDARWWRRDELVLTSVRVKKG
jgi:4'-phosphopantetheinyl transferase EntD